MNYRLKKMLKMQSAEMHGLRKVVIVGTTVENVNVFFSSTPQS